LEEPHLNPLQRRGLKKKQVNQEPSPLEEPHLNPLQGRGLKKYANQEPSPLERAG